jgi:DNA replication protein DnaC
MAVSSFSELIKASNFGDELSRESTCMTHGNYTEIGHVFFEGKTIWTGCRVCSKSKADAEEKIRRDIQNQAKQEKIEARLNQAGIPMRFRSRNFDNFIPATSDQEHALSVAKSFADHFSEHVTTGRSLIFSGRAGTGKSHLALAIAQAVMPKHTAMYINALDAVRMIRDTWRKGSAQSETDVLNLLESIDLLVIDEVGVQNGTENEQVLMFDIINRRYRDMKPTIFLTNLGTKGFSEYVTERSYDRLKECSTWVTFNWDSYRGKGKR